MFDQPFASRSMSTRFEALPVRIQTTCKRELCGACAGTKSLSFVMRT